MAEDPQKPATATAPDLPDGSFTQKYAPHMTVVAALFGFMEIFRASPSQSLDLFATFGPKYLLWAFIAYVIWDLAKKAIRVLAKGVDKIGLMAENTGKVAGAIQSMDTKGDRTADEMRRLCSFAASQSERAVELSSKNNETAEKNHELLLQLLAKQGVKTQGEG